MEERKIEEIKNRDDLYGENAKYLGHNLFIEAGAGAGKTETIINVVVRQLFQGVKPEQIVVITFTNKATEELINRISNILKDAICSDSYSVEQVDILKYALNHIYKMNVSTIHHFCNVILNENSYDAKISYNAKLIEEPDELKRQRQFYSKWFRSLNKKQLDEISDCSDDGFKEIKKFYFELCKNFDDAKIVTKLSFDIEDFINSLLSLYYELDNILNKYGTFGSSSTNALNFYYFIKSNIIDKKLTNQNEIFESCFAQNPSNLDITNKSIKLIKKESTIPKSDIDSLNLSLTLYASKTKLLSDIAKVYLSIKHYSILYPYIIDAWEKYKVSRDNVSLTNNQLIYKTYDLIKCKTEVCEKIARKYDLIVVDEFQDTDKYQNLLITYLALAINNRKRKDGHSSTSLVLVGDPKQSIYGFRGADFDMFMKAKNSFELSGLDNAINVFLPDNYRSNKFVLDWINDNFSKFSFYDSYDYRKMLLPVSSELPKILAPKTLAGVYNYNFNNGNKWKNLAEFIKNLVTGGYIIYSKATKSSPLSPRNIHYSDILVLTTSKSEINDYVLEFNKLGIKSSVAGEFDLCSSGACCYIYRIIEFFIGNNNNSRKLFASNFNGDVYTTTKLDEIKEKIKTFSPYGKLAYLLNNIDLVQKNFNSCDGNLLKTILSQVFESIAYDDSVSSNEILDKISDLLETPSEDQISLINNEDAVTIMNIHKAKGLTYEIVIWADSGGFYTGNSAKVLNDEIYLGNIALFPDKCKEYKDKSEAEKLRLEYVAATRAKQALIFESKLISRGKLFIREEYPYDFSHLDQYHNEVEFDDIPLAPVPTNTYQRISSDGFKQADTSLKTIMINETSPSSLESKVAITPTNSEKYQRPANNVFGTLLHRVMELFVLNKAVPLGDLVNRALEECEDNIADLSSYNKYLFACASAGIQLYKEKDLFSKFSGVMPELKFYDFSNSLYGPSPTLMNGSIDLLLLDNDSALIIDYKSDSNPFDNISDFEKLLCSRYRTQLETYKKYVSSSLKISEDKIKTRIMWFEETKDKTIAHFANL